MTCMHQRLAAWPGQVFTIWSGLLWVLFGLVLIGLLFTFRGVL